MARSIYIAGVYEDRQKLQYWEQEFERAGHVVKASWLFEKAIRGTLNAEQEAVICVRDLQDIDDCDTLVIFGDAARRGQGGRNVELGYAIGTGKLIIVVGFRENPFWYHPAVVFVEEASEVLGLI